MRRTWKIYIAYKHAAGRAHGRAPKRYRSDAVCLSAEPPHTVPLPQLLKMQWTSCPKLPFPCLYAYIAHSTTRPLLAESYCSRRRKRPPREHIAIYKRFSSVCAHRIMPERVSAELPFFPFFLLFPLTLNICSLTSSCSLENNVACLDRKPAGRSTAKAGQTFFRRLPTRCARWSYYTRTSWRQCCWQDDWRATASRRTK